MISQKCEAGFSFLRRDFFVAVGESVLEFDAGINTEASSSKTNHEKERPKELEIIKECPATCVFSPAIP